MSRIIIIEDNPSDREIVTTALREAGLLHEIISFSDGASGIEFVSRDSNCNSACLFIVDINLPRKSGHQVLEAIQNGPCMHVPVIAMTSSDRPEDATFQHAHYFRKPIDLDAFLGLGPFARRVMTEAEKIPCHCEDQIRKNAAGS